MGREECSAVMKCDGSWAERSAGVGGSVEGEGRRAERSSQGGEEDMVRFVKGAAGDDGMDDGC